jgi:4-diphosphocytidyl-2-C-methyl-D-erythritol kinase
MKCITPSFKSKNVPGGLNLSSPAKINLFLSIEDRRSDGYHLLFTLMCPIGIFDRIRLETRKSHFEVTCNHPDVPEDDSNFALQAARCFIKALEYRLNTCLGAVAIRIEKNIPIGAGLGGGSSNAATILLGLNRYFGGPFSLDTLMRMGLEIGADVPFFLYERPAIATGIGEILEPYEWIEPYLVLVIYPGFSLSTAMVYKKLNLRLTKCKKKINYFSFKKEKFQPSLHLCNDLESAAMALYSELSEIKTLLMRLGACGALMSGSGSSIFGLFDNNEFAQKAYEVLRQKKRWHIHLTNLILSQ